MKKVITPAALKHILVPFFAIILIFCNSLNFINADETQTTQATALGTITDNDVTYVVDCSVTGVSVYNDSLGVWNTYPKFTAYVVADQAVNGYFTFQFHFSYAYAGTDIRYINLCVELSDGYGTLELVGSESYNYGGMYTDCSIDNMDVYVMSVSDSSEITIDTTYQDYLLEAINFQHYDCSDVINNLDYITVASSVPYNTATTVTNGYNTYKYLIFVFVYNGTSYTFYTRRLFTTFNTHMYFFSNGIVFDFYISLSSNTTVTYTITEIERDGTVTELSSSSLNWINRIYATNDNPANDNLYLEELTEETNEQLETGNGWLSDIYDGVINIYNFLTDDSDTAAATEIDNTVSDLQSATSTVESTQSDFTAQLQDYSAGIDLDDYDFDSTSAFTAANTYYKYILTETYNASGEFKYLLIIPLILAVFCFIVGVV